MADAVLKLLETNECLAPLLPLLSLHDKKIEDLIRVEMYSNGREQGYHLKVQTRAYFAGISFSENRNSDEIVVYSNVDFTLKKGTFVEQFSMQGNVPSDEVWRVREMFSSPVEAAKFIVTEVIKVLKAE